jgi:head-tail adaptor
MAICKKLRRVDQRPCIGDMDRTVILNVREIKSATDCGPDFTESITVPKSVPAYVKTIAGPNVFDDTNINNAITHEIWIRYFPNFTAESWLTLKSKDSSPDAYLKILDTENFNEQNRFYKIRCTIRGDIGQPVNLA